MINNNHIYNNLSTGIILKPSETYPIEDTRNSADTDMSRNINIFSNFIKANGSVGLICVAGNNINIYDNNIEDNWNSGIVLWGVETEIKNNKFANNNRHINGLGFGSGIVGIINLSQSTIHIKDSSTYSEKSFNLPNEYNFMLNIINNNLIENNVGSNVDNEKIGIYFDSELSNINNNTKNNIKIDNNNFNTQNYAINLSNLNLNNLDLSINDNYYTNIIDYPIKQPSNGYYSELVFNNHSNYVKVVNIIPDYFNFNITLYEGNDVITTTSLINVYKAK